MENFDIKVLLLNIRKNISLIEKGLANEMTFRDVENDYLDLLELLKLHLISKHCKGW